MADILITHGKVGTMDGERRFFEDGAVAIEGNKIVAVGPTSEVTAAHSAVRTIDATGKVIAPGLICTHGHMASTLSHNMPVDFSKFTKFTDMMEMWWWPQVEDQTFADDIYWATKYAAARMLKSGTTTIGDMLEAPSALPGALDHQARACDEAGIRAVLAFEATERTSKELGEMAVQENLRFVKERNKPDARVTGCFSCHTAYTASPDMLRETRKLANETGAGLFIHVAEFPPQLTVDKWGKADPQVLEETGFLGPDVMTIHCIHMTDEDIDLWAQHDVKVAHTPMSNMLGGIGVANIPQMMSKGITVSLGHDCFFTLDVIEVMRAAYLIHKVVPGPNPANMIFFQALEMATVNGAKALNMAKEIGSLEVGKKADVLIIEDKCPTPINAGTWMWYLVHDMSSADVETVFVDGQIVVEDHKLMTIDEEEALCKSQEQAWAMWKRAGVV
ncbi:MAG: amidohydrolase [Anaerolineales bacterium]|jgi:cytosine/adenosine deaminase-related metal-dependent hydrolase|nr:amidohydrolase [Anaerolineales bacterium]|tara:strand:+ start:17060 stop:18400 length:1341 start_codon:yes stop_codon:yes gene_type:complete